MIVLLISLLLRWTLILRGGQYYISDETRYEVSRDAARFLFQGQVGEALRQFTISPEHLLFKVVGIVPTLMEHLLGTSLALSALFFSFFSVFNLYLIFLLAQRTAGSSNEPLYALLLAGACLSLLYYSRHLFPYDMALSFGLLTLYVVLRRNPSVQTSLLCGGLSFLCFITYNGYWPLAGFAMLANVFIHDGKITRILKKIVWTATGFLAPLVLLIILMLWSGTDMISAYRLFATSITQGNFEEGWSLPFEYFWHAEHAVILVLGALAVIAILGHIRHPRRETLLWLGGIVFIYLCLLIPSVILHYFVVYGRLARQLIPFMVLLAAQGLAQLEHRAAFGHRIVALILMTVFVQAGLNFVRSYALTFPREFVALAQSKYPPFEFSSKRLAFGAPVICQNNGYIMENAKYYVTPPEVVPQVQGELLLSAPHPLNFLPYQYDGYSPVTRQIFRTQGLKMNFYEVDEAIISDENPAWSEIKNCMIHEK
jgi:hypothetical protein